MSDPRIAAAETAVAAVCAAAGAIDNAIPFLRGATAHLAFDATRQITSVQDDLGSVAMHMNSQWLARVSDATTRSDPQADKLRELSGKMQQETRTFIGIRAMVPTDAGYHDFNTLGIDRIEEAHRAVRKAATLATMLVDPDYRPGIQDFRATDPRVLRDDSDEAVYAHPLHPAVRVRIITRGTPGARGYVSDIEYDVAPET